MTRLPNASGVVRCRSSASCLRRAIPLPALAGATRRPRTVVYAGKAGRDHGKTVRERLAPLYRKTPLLAKSLKRPDRIWVEPTVIADNAFTELTEDGMLRHASFKGLKE